MMQIGSLIHKIMVIIFFVPVFEKSLQNMRRKIRRRTHCGASFESVVTIELNYSVNPMGRQLSKRIPRKS